MYLLFTVRHVTNDSDYWLSDVKAVQNLPPAEPAQFSWAVPPNLQKTVEMILALAETDPLWGVMLEALFETSWSKSDGSDPAEMRCSICMVKGKLQAHLLKPGAENPVEEPLWYGNLPMGETGRHFSALIVHPALRFDMEWLTMFLVTEGHNARMRLGFTAA